MKNILKTLLLSLLSLVFVLGMFACNGKDDKATEKGIKCTGSNNEYKVVKYVEEDDVTVLDIESAVKSKYGQDAVVVEIVTGAFDGNTTLKKVIVPDTVTEIGKGAFKNMKALEEITLPFVGGFLNADADIGISGGAVKKAINEERFFGYIFSDEQYNGGSTITQSYKKSGETESVTYYIPMFLKTVNIAPSANYAIPMYAFSGITSIETVNFNGNVKGIGRNAFAGIEQDIVINIGTDWDNINKYEDWNDGSESLKIYKDSVLVNLD